MSIHRSDWLYRPQALVLVLFATLQLATTLHAAELKRGFLQYFLDTQELMAWRESDPSTGNQIQLDYPEKRALTRTEAIDLKRRLALQHENYAPSLQNYVEEQVSFDPSNTDPEFKNAPPVLTQSRSGDCKLPNYTLNRVIFKRKPPTPEFVVRLQPRTCSSDSALAQGGSAAMISPRWAITAAHILTQDGKIQDCDYRLIPGGDSFSAAQSQPLGSLRAKTYALAQPGLDILDNIDQISEAQFNNRSNDDWGILAIEAAVSNNQTAAQLWPIYEFHDHEDSDQQVMKSGFPRGKNTRSLRSAGASLSSQGLRVCQNKQASELFALTADFGDSGAPIWVLPQLQAERRLRVISLVASAEVFGSVPRVHGPKFSLDMYFKILEMIKRAEVQSAK
jgi:hypothetical protein